MKKHYSSSTFKGSLEFLDVSLEDFARFSGFSVDYVRSISCGRRKKSTVISRLLFALMKQQRDSGINDCKIFAMGEEQ